MFRIGISLACLLAFSCSSDKKDDPASELPVANSWNGQGTAGDRVLSAPADPHAGLNMGAAADPHAGLDMGGAADPHAGLNMGGASDPHAGLDMGEGGNPGGLQAPDPNRAVDPSKFLKGSISTAKNTAGLVKPGAIIFVSVRPINKATGESLGSPLAVERFDIQSLPVEFHLTGAHTMVAGTAFEGDVMVYARVDSDGEASSKLAGDVEGSVMASIPAEGLSLVLDTVVP